MHRSSVWLWAFFALTALTSSVVRASADAAVAKTTIPISPDFTNVKLLRVLDLRTNIVQEDLGVRAKNIQSYPVSEYIFMLPQEEEEKAASVSAFLRQEPKTSLSITQVGFDSEKQVQLYKITFDEPVQPGQEIRFGVKIAYTHALEPLPARIPQVARQFVLYNGNVYSYSAYPSDEIKTTVQLPTKMIQSFTGGDFVQQSGNKIIYGPFENAGPELFAPLRLHYEYSKPLLTVTELRRDLQVSHWGNNLAVEEDYKLYHAGAQLEEEFSRITYQMTRMVHSQTNVLKDLTFRLPAGARDVYYRDEIGNVSTSHFRPDKDAAIFQFAPRYPLFGGWNYTWYHGYNVDLNKFVRYSKETGQYMLNVNFVDNVYDMAVDKLRLNIVLPEGATNVKVHAPFKLDREEHATHFTNFDSTGRYLLILEKHNVVKEHEQPIQITYEYPSYRLLQKPLVVSGCLFTLFMISTILSKISFTIGTPKKPALKKE